MHPDFISFNMLRQLFPSADMVENLVVFNIGGNKYRLIAAIHFNRRKGIVSEVLAGKRDLNIRMIRHLSERFKLDSKVFV